MTLRNSVMENDDKETITPKNSNLELLTVVLVGHFMTKVEDGKLVEVTRFVFHSACVV